MSLLVQERRSFRRFLPAPSCSSAARGWSCATVELYQLGDMDFVGNHREHLVSVQLRDCASLYQQREGRECERSFRAGEVIVTPAGEPKRWRRHGTGSVLVIGLAPHFLDDTLASATSRAGHATLLDNFGTRDPQIESIAYGLRDELTGGQVGGRLYAEAAVQQLAVHLLRRYCDVRTEMRGVAAMPSHKLKGARDFIEEHLGEDLSVEAIARHVAMSPFHFAHAFRAATGAPPHRFVLARRVERAKSLLRTTELPLTEIARRVGFATSSHFSVAFRNAVRQTPSQYRTGS